MHALRSGHYVNAAGIIGSGYLCPEKGFMCLGGAQTECTQAFLTQSPSNNFEVQFARPFLLKLRKSCASLTVQFTIISLLLS